MKISSLLRFVIFLLPTLALADPVTELAGFSAFGKVDLAQLAKSGVKTAAGTPMNTPRYLSVQSCLILPKSPAEILRAMQQFDPAAHRELRVYLHSDLPSAPSAAAFSALSHPPSNSGVNALAAATEKMSPELQLNRTEAQKFFRGQAPFVSWTNLLTERAQVFARGGAAAQPPYDHSGPALQSAKEFSGLVRQQSAVDRQFGSFLAATGLTAGKGSLKASQYWELLQVEDDGVLTLGASYSRPTSGGGFQAADGLYYASGGYYVALTLFQLWPVEVGGKPSTLMWRGDFISAASLGDLHGIERIASEGAMKKDIARAVGIFQKDAGR
jgi:hypothetical protein